MNIIIDGYEPISNSITNAILSLFNNPVQLNEFLNIESIPDSYIYEMIRYDPPFQYIVRQSLTNFSIYDKEIKKSDRIILLISSANYDEDIFSMPFNLNFGRETNPNFSFGIGSHYCPGSDISIPIIKTALQVFLKHVPNFKINVNQLYRYESLGSRPLKNLFINW